MNDSELEAKLRASRVPERSDEYWEDFPGRLRVLARRQRRTQEPRRSWPALSPWWFRGAGFAAAVVLIFFCLQFHAWQAMTTTVARDKHYLQSHIAKLNAGLHRLVLNADGMTNMVSEANLN